MLQCVYADRWALMNDLVGTPREWPHKAGLFASSASAKALPGRGGESGQAMTYVTANVTVNYSTDTPEAYSESIEPTVEFVQEDYRRFRWTGVSGDPLTEAEAPGRLVRGLKLVRTLYRLESVPIEAMTHCGACNDEEYESASLGLVFPEETLLYGAPKLSRSVTATGAKGWQLEMSFDFKENGWNKYWRAKSNAWEAIYLYMGVGAAEWKSYPPMDFSVLLF